MTAPLRLVFALLAAIAAGGCSYLPFGGDGGTPPASEESRSDTPNRALMATVDDAEALRDPAARELRRIQQQIRRLQSDVLDAQMVNQAASRARVSARPGPAVGLLLGDMETPLRVAMERAFARVAGDHPISLVPTAVVDNALENAGCTARRAQPCLDALAVSHGLRLLARIEPMAASSDSRDMRVRLIDTELGVEYPPFTVSVPTAGERIPQPALEALADNVYLNAVGRLQVAPRFAHALLQVEGDWVLNQGRRSGLESGQRLVAYNGGRVVRGPGGEPLTWIPDARIGVLEVDGFTPNGLALARLVSGEAPSPGDELVPEGG